MAADQLVADRAGHVVEGEGFRLVGHLRVKHHLEQQIAQFVLEVIQIAPLDRVGDLIGFLDRVGRDRTEILLQIPGAAGSGRAQGRHDLDQARDVHREVAPRFAAESGRANKKRREALRGASRR